VGERVSERLLLVVVPAAMLAGADLAVKATVSTAVSDFHQRSGAWVALSGALLVGALALALVPSRAVALAAGVMSAGVLGNLVSARLDGDTVPNPFMVGDYTNGLAFNLADVFFLLGNLLLMAALIATTVRNRDRLIPPRQWERTLRRRLKP
jgi:lipoprotein signal peptidase